MPVAPRGRSYQATVNYRGVRLRKQFRSHREAVAWEATTHAALARGDLPVPATVYPTVAPSMRRRSYRPKTIGQLAEYLIIHKWSVMKSGKTAALNLRHAVKLLGERTLLRDVSSHSINLLVDDLRGGGYPDNTINKKLSTIRQCLKYAEREGWIDRLPQMPFFKPGEPPLRYFAEAEERAMLHWCRKHLAQMLMDYIVVSFDTGLRQGEVLNLKARNIHGGRVTLWGATTADNPGTKSGNTRVVPLTPRAQDVLERLALDNPGLLFPVSKDEITGLWNRMRTALGHRHDRDYVPHAMRHTFCSRLVERNVNLAVVQKLAGHQRIETTLKYVHLRDDALVQAIATLTPLSGPTPSTLLH